MPIFWINGELAHFAHVPKCAGSSVERYLEERFGPLAFLDRYHFDRPKDEIWTASSPQHIPIDAFARLFPPDFIKHKFAVVRHPARRAASAFWFNREVNHRLWRRMTFDLWLWRLEKGIKIDHAFFDYHFLPQTSFIGDDYKLFRLEDGLEPLIAYLDGLAGDTAPALSLKHENRGFSAPGLTDAQTRRLERIYAGDYEAFGYERSFRQD